MTKGEKLKAKANSHSLTPAFIWHWNKDRVYKLRTNMSLPLFLFSFFCNCSFFLEKALNMAIYLKTKQDKKHWAWSRAHSDFSELWRWILDQILMSKANSPFIPLGEICLYKFRTCVHYLPEKPEKASLELYLSYISLDGVCSTYHTYLYIVYFNAFSPVNWSRCSVNMYLGTQKSPCEISLKGSYCACTVATFIF